MAHRTDAALNLLTVIVALASLVMAGTVVRREFFTSSGELAQIGPPVEVKNWEELASGGSRIGPANAAVTIVEFSDFQCPYCRRFALGTLRSLRKEFPQDVALVYRDFPLSNHGRAYALARAGRCAASQGYFEPFHDLLFLQQDSLKTKPLRSLALESKVPDLAKFELCVNDTTRHTGIEADLALGRKIRVTGTPTVVVNGWQLSAGADSVVVDSLVRSMVKAKAGRVADVR
jgi:protein-disulfide isomerase